MDRCSGTTAHRHSITKWVVMEFKGWHGVGIFNPPWVTGWLRYKWNTIAWMFAKSTVASVPCFVENSKTTGQRKRIIWTNEKSFGRISQKVPTVVLKLRLKHRCDLVGLGENFENDLTTEQYALGKRDFESFKFKMRFYPQLSNMGVDGIYWVQIFKCLTLI